MTGASRGIGKGIAQGFAQKGARVAMTYQTSDETAQKALSEMPFKDLHKLYKFDVSDYGAAEENLTKISSEMGGLHVLVNNAGITRDQLLLRLKPEDWDAVIQTNLRSVYNMSKVALKLMLKAKEGNIINITSVIGQTGNAGQSNYAASKAGIIGFTKSIAAEVASRQIRINCIAPGFIRSDMTDSLTEDQKKTIMDKIPMGFIGESNDVAECCLFLASPMSRYITGQTLNVNGGLHMT